MEIKHTCVESLSALEDRQKFRLMTGNAMNQIFTTTGQQSVTAPHAARDSSQAGTKTTRIRDIA